MRLIKKIRIISVDQENYFLLNGINGAIDLLDQKGYQILQKWREQKEINPQGDESELFSALLNRGYLVKDANEEKIKITELYAELERNLNNNQNKIDPILVLTYDCNFRCPYCYETTVMDKGKNWLNKRITPEMTQILFDYFDKYEIEQITLYGGEPLLPDNHDTIEAVVNYVITHDLKLSIVSNGFHLEKFIPSLKKAQVQKIQITLDGNEERHNQTRYTANKQGTFQKIIQNIKKARENDLPIFLRCNVDIDDPIQVKNLLQTLEEHGLSNDSGIELFVAALREGEHLKEKSCNNLVQKYITQIDRCIDYPISTDEMLVKLSHIASNFLGDDNWHPKYIYCYAHSSLRVFDPYGNIYPCTVLLGRENDIIGTYSERGVVFNNLFHQWQSRTVKNMPKCKECELSLFCGGSCAGQASIQERDLFEPECADMEAYLSELLPYLYKKYVKEAI